MLLKKYLFTHWITARKPLLSNESQRKQCFLLILLDDYQAISYHLLKKVIEQLNVLSLSYFRFLSRFHSSFAYHTYRGIIIFFKPRKLQNF